MHYDAAGFLSRLEWLGAGHSPRHPQLRQTDYEFDKGGRLRKRRSAMAEYVYDYDDADRLLKLYRKPTAEGVAAGVEENRLVFEWDKKGQLLSERCDDKLLAYQWSPTGYLSGLMLPDSSRLEWLCYGPGHVSAI